MLNIEISRTNVEIQVQINAGKIFTG